MRNMRKMRAVDPRFSRANANRKRSQTVCPASPPARPPLIPQPPFRAWRPEDESLSRMEKFGIVAVLVAVVAVLGFFIYKISDYRQEWDTSIPIPPKMPAQVTCDVHLDDAGRIQFSQSDCHEAPAGTLPVPRAITTLDVQSCRHWSFTGTRQGDGAWACKEPEPHDGVANTLK